MLRICLAFGLLASSVANAALERHTTETGTVSFRLHGDQSSVPERYRLEEHTFSYEMEPKFIMPNIGVEVFRIRFPSAVESPHPENNTVHADYYRPMGKGPFPCSVVLDITGGDQSLSRLISTHLAQHQIAALFVQMAYYGPRRPPGSRLRLLSPNIPHTMAAVQQTVLDLRRATAWMESRPELDPKRLGIMGTSLGSFMAALTAEMEPKLGRVVVLLGGGGFVDAYYDHPQASGPRKMWEAVGGSKQKIKDTIAPVDPITCAENLKGRKLLIIAGKRDDIVPPSATIALWKASGEQKIVWYDCTHYSAVLFYGAAMQQITAHLGAD